jgi:hypothetical protein
LLPQPEKAFQLCQLGAKLVINSKAGVDFVAAATLQTDRPTVDIMAVMAQHEREMIFNAYQGCPAGCQAAEREAWRRSAPIVKELQVAGCESLQAIAAGLDEYGIPAARGGKWSPVQVVCPLEPGRPFDGAGVAAG